MPSGLCMQIPKAHQRNGRLVMKFLTEKLTPEFDSQREQTFLKRQGKKIAARQAEGGESATLATGYDS